MCGDVPTTISDCSLSYGCDRPRLMVQLVWTLVMDRVVCSPSNGRCVIFRSDAAQSSLPVGMVLSPLLVSV